MKRSAVVSGVAAGFFLLSPALAFATTPTTGTPVPVSTPGSPVTGYTSTPASPKPPLPTVTASPKTAHPGDKITAIGRCYQGHDPRTIIQGWGPGEDGSRFVRELHKVVKPVGAGGIVEVQFQLTADAPVGDYSFTLLCDGREPSAFVHVVAPKAPATDKKQVAKVPAGAPQTGGTDGPVEGGPNGVAIAAAGAGVLAAGGAGLVVARRRARGNAS